LVQTGNPEVIHWTQKRAMHRLCYAHFVFARVVSKGKTDPAIGYRNSADEVSAYPKYNIPFNLIAQRAKTEDWLAEMDSNRLANLANLNIRGLPWALHAHCSWRHRKIAG
jgi:hypothetical protein